ncbi:hypothetical protein ACHAWO_004072 [Cyclotella atomus]|uniref:Uncharacterized protein n=1 Tax=Cyclotella atomus TaxID=382360 RepID=A0ABD3MZX8_9STRA
MTISLDHIPTANNSAAQPLRTQRQDVKNRSRPTYTPCGSPPRFRDRSPELQQHHRPTKAPRSVSPGGTPASHPCLRRPSDGRRSPSPEGGRVHWASTLELSVVTRPKTCREDIPKLFYSKADERRFRREAELEDVCDADTSSPRKDYAISKAVVVFGETTRTYDGSIWSFSNCAVVAKDESFNFDDPAFWNGILTWS